MTRFRESPSGRVWLDDDGAAQGAILRRTAGGIWTFLAPGAAGELLQTGGPAADPSWVTAPGVPTQTQGIGDPQTATDDGFVSVAISNTIWRGGTYIAHSPISFNRIVLRERGGGAGVNVDVAIYQASDGVVVDPWPLLASASYVAAAGASTLTLTPTQALPRVLQQGPFVLMLAGDGAAAVVEGYQIGQIQPLTGNMPAGTYPTNFFTALPGPPAAIPASLSFAAMGGGSASDFSPAVRFYTV
jgi:hypothetical protein